MEIYKLVSTGIIFNLISYIICNVLFFIELSMGGTDL